MPDLMGRELALLACCTFGSIVLGFFPGIIL